jgi:hypothetical protein
MDREQLDAVRATHCKGFMEAVWKAEASGVEINAHDKALVEFCKGDR